VRRIVADKIVKIQMDLEHLSCADDDLPPAMLSLWEKMEKALSLLKNSLGIGLQNLPYPHLCVPNSTLLEYRQLEGRKGLSCPELFAREWNCGFPEWTSNVRYYRPSEYSHLSDAISCGVRGIIAFPVFDSAAPMHCRAVLELVTMEEKQDFDLETEKASQALQVCFHYVYFFNQILDNVENTTQFIIRI
jgi:hypothetical protein